MTINETEKTIIYKDYILGEYTISNAPHNKDETFGIVVTEEALKHALKMISIMKLNKVFYEDYENRKNYI